MGLKWGRERIDVSPDRICQIIDLCRQTMPYKYLLNWENEDERIEANFGGLRDIKRFRPDNIVCVS